jgi:uncharacterized membrane protein YphA (DoxX/SURF4 family)
MMMSLFPQLFTYRELAPFILRLALGFFAISFGYSKLKKPAEVQNFIIGLIESCAGIFLIAGFLMQLAAGLIIITMLFEIFRPGLVKDYKFLALIIIALIALMFLGPGFFSIDLPL